jgi:hypothetical protein
VCSSDLLARHGHTGGRATPLSDEQREKLHAQIKALDEVAAVVRKAMAPFENALSAVEDVRQQLLDDHDAAIAGTCECGRLLLVGELGHSCEDGPLLCETCAPTWNDMRRQYDDAKRRGDLIDRFDSVADMQQADEAVDERIAGGDGDKKWVWPL